MTPNDGTTNPTLTRKMSTINRHIIDANKFSKSEKWLHCSGTESDSLLANRKMVAYQNSRLSGLKLFVVYLTVFLVITLFFTGRVGRVDHDDNKLLYEKYRENLLTSQSIVQNKHILLWTPFFSEDTWYLGSNFLDKTVS
jgi:hypothetical protein